MTRKPADEPASTEVDADFSEEEIARQRDAVIKKMFATPPKKHSGQPRRAPKREK